MNRTIFLALLAAVACPVLASMPVRADSNLSPEKLDALDERGYFTPGFKAAVHDLVDAKDQLAEVTAEKDKLTKDLPALEKQSAQAVAETVALRGELARYDHPEDNDFEALESRMKDPSAKVSEQIALAQAYVWTYPTSGHLAEAQQYLAQAQKAVADEAQAEKDSSAARIAAAAKLLAHAQAHDLSLPEWRGFLLGMSQEDLIKNLGRPTTQGDDGYWIYSGDWVTNGTRVLTVDEKP
jgi:hypothetical protein